MSQKEDTPVKRTLQVRGSIDAERMLAVLQKAGSAGYTLEIATTAGPAGAAPEAEGGGGEGGHGEGGAENRG
jgi:hypothetical protein